jgi:arabinofuranosyltransferase
MRKRIWFHAAAVWLLIFTAVFLILILFSLHQNSTAPEFSATLEHFRSDFDSGDKEDTLIQTIIQKKNQFAAYGTYIRVPRGAYKAEFYFNSESSRSAGVTLQVAADRGKTIVKAYSIDLDAFPQIQTIRFKAWEEKELEPRVLHRTGSRDFDIEKIILEKTGGLIGWGSILLQSLLAASLLALVFLSFFYAGKKDRRWTVFLSAVFFFLGCFLILRKAWVSEDAFITLRYIENFLDGLGPVFNAGERVEGYTHPLWFGVVSFFRWLGLSAKGSVILPGLTASFSALFLLLFRIRFSNQPDSGTSLNPGAVILIGTSAFIDFGTSGLETPLSYLLLVIYAKFIAENRWKTQPVVMGLVLALLVLTRPDFGLLIIFLFCFYLYDLFKHHIPVKKTAGVLMFPVLLVGGWQIFRMGYYAALFPNPVYTKTGAGTYFSQGIKYLIDLFQGSMLWAVLFLAMAALLTQIRGRSLKNRALIFFSGLLHGFFVVRGGGDFMHGRYLLPAFILIAASMSGSFDRLVQKKTVHKHMYIVLSLVLFYLSYQIQPVQLRGRYYNYGISNERLAYYQNEIIPLKHLFTDTVIFMWKTIGRNYRSLAQRTNADIRIAYNNVGYVGYYAGKKILLIDKLGLADPVISRVVLQGRERPGHEKHAPFGYLMLRNLTFADTPFPVWNEIADTRYGIIWDLSPRTLALFDFMLPDGFKKRLDARIRSYLTGLEDQLIADQADFLFFLKQVWYPYAGQEGQALFRRVYRKDSIVEFSSSYQWIQENRAGMNKLFDRIGGPLTVRKFIHNILFAAGEGRTIEFDDQRFILK